MFCVLLNPWSGKSRIMLNLVIEVSLFAPRTAIAFREIKKPTGQSFQTSKTQRSRVFLAIAFVLANFPESKPKAAPPHPTSAAFLMRYLCMKIK